MHQAAAATKQGFRNSDGWTEAKPRLSQRVAPLPKSVPMKGSANTTSPATKNPSTPSRRTCRGVSSEMTNIASSPMLPNTA